MNNLWTYSKAQKTFNTIVFLSIVGIILIFASIWFSPNLSLISVIFILCSLLVISSFAYNQAEDLQIKVNNALTESKFIYPAGKATVVFDSTTNLPSEIHLGWDRYFFEGEDLYYKITTTEISKDLTLFFVSFEGIESQKNFCVVHEVNRFFILGSVYTVKPPNTPWKYQES